MQENTPLCMYVWCMMYVCMCVIRLRLTFHQYEAQRTNALTNGVVGRTMGR